uniref:Uncharacterized protein n=1 Tax=Zea mays TaxID=4577 RepID=A0A804UAI7_MAIZE
MDLIARQVHIVFCVYVVVSSSILFVGKTLIGIFPAISLIGDIVIVGVLEGGAVVRTLRDHSIPSNGDINERAKAKSPIYLLSGLRRRSTAHAKFGPSHHERKESIGAPIKLDVEAHAHIQKHRIVMRNLTYSEPKADELAASEMAVAYSSSNWCVQGHWMTAFHLAYRSPEARFWYFNFWTNQLSLLFVSKITFSWHIFQHYKIIRICILMEYSFNPLPFLTR